MTLVVAATFEELATMLHVLASAMRLQQVEPPSVAELAREKTLRLAVVTKLRDVADLLEKL